MKKITLSLILCMILFFLIPLGSWAEVYDLDALTNITNVNESTTTTNQSVNTNVTINSNQPTTTNTNINGNEEISAAEITIAECIIFERLEIYDARCDKLTRELNCPNYAECLQTCAQDKNSCFTILAEQPNKSYNTCVTYHNNCLDRCADANQQCSKIYPPRNVEGVVKAVELTDSRGDVRVTYQDNPRPFDMDAVTDNRTIQVGATIFTGNNSFTMITLPSGITQFVGPNSYFRIVDYYTSENVDQMYSILKNGNIRVKIDRQEEKKAEYVVITPLWRVEANGTTFELTVQKNGDTQLNTASGEVQLRDHKDTLVAAVPAGENLTIAASGSIISSSADVFFPDSSRYYINTYGKTALIISAILITVIAVIVLVVLIIFARRKKRRQI